MRALVTGATGLVGRELLTRLRAAAILTRRGAIAARGLPAGVEPWSWQPQREAAPAAAFGGVDVVFHLAGEPIAEGRWSAEKKRRIRDSRVIGTRNLVRAIEALPVRPRALISASGISYYGDRGDDELDEGAPLGEGFLAEVCRDWEAEARAAEPLGVRVCLMRLGVVLSAAGGALSRMLPPFRLGVGGRLGSGKQWMSWVHVDDVIGALMHAAAHESVRGPVNVVSPGPVTNDEFTRQLASALGRPRLFTVPRVALRVALGELSTALLESQRALPRAALSSGYTFCFPEVSSALEACLHASK